jgi:tetratricopeptide (TPR) repeat protein
MTALDAAAGGPARRAAFDASFDVSSGDAAPWCQESARDGCMRDAMMKAQRLVQIEPSLCEGYALLARVRIAGGDTTGALRDLERATNEVTDPLSCLKQLVAVAIEAGDEAKAEAAIEKLTIVGCSNGRACAENLAWVGRQLEAMNKSHRALAIYRRAFQRDPDDELLERIAALAADGGLHAQAAADYDQLARRHPETPKWRQLASEQRDAAMRQSMKL